MALVTDVDSDLRGLARRVPEDIRATLSETELHLRCQGAAQLVGEAEASGDDRKRSQAQKLLKAARPSSYRITMGVRPSDQNWKRQLNTLIAQNHEAIDKVLMDFGVPLLDANDQAITGDAATPKQ